jgi:polyhydroxybutyrate depolymerase
MKLIFSFLFFLFSFSSFCQDFEKTITVDNIKREYAIHLPPSFSTAKKLPVIFGLHGGGGTYKNTIPQYGLNDLADKNNFIIVYPNAINKAWNMPGISSRIKKLDTSVNDVHFISVLLDTLIANYKADAKHVFTTGISRGAMFSFYLACNLSERITAIAPVCGSISKTVAADYIFKHPTPVLMINGTNDPLVSYNGGIGKMNKGNEENEDADMMPTELLLVKILQLNNCNNKATTTNIPDVDTKDGCTAVDNVYNCGNIQVEFIKVIGGGHTWPGGKQYLPKFIVGNLCKDFSAAEKIFAFFMAVK